VTFHTVAVLNACWNHEQSTTNYLNNSIVPLGTDTVTNNEFKQKALNLNKSNEMSYPIKLLNLL
jgi:hypothetical protein